MTETEKSLALAELMGWHVGAKMPAGDYHVHIQTMRTYTDRERWLMPYREGHIDGLAQFATILLRFGTEIFNSGEFLGDEYGYLKEPTQANILDEILRMKGKWQEAWNG